MIVDTLNSVYEIDLVAKTVTRTVIWGEPLRRDDEPLHLYELHPPVVGEPMRMLIQIEDGIPTLRTTSEVMSIR